MSTLGHDIYMLLPLRPHSNVDVVVDDAVDALPHLIPA